MKAEHGTANMEVFTHSLVSVSLASSFDLTKTLVIAKMHGADASTGGSDDRFAISAKLTNATTLELQREADQATIRIAWSVIELDGINVQAVDYSTAVEETAASITPVDPARSFVIGNYRTSDATTNAFQKWSPTFYLSSDGTAVNISKLTTASVWGTFFVMEAA